MTDPLNTFEDSEVTAHQFLHRLLSTNIFEDHPITVSILEDLNAILDTIPNQNGVGDQNVMVQIWNPMLGLIIDVQAPRATFPAAALLRVCQFEFLGLFIWSFPSDYITITNIVLPLVRKPRKTSGCF